MMISIITPTFNRAKLIGNMINSVINQTYTDWELIIVDDGSKDDTKEVIQPYLKNARIRYIRKENSGATHSRNVGALQAKGSFITFLDSDDEAYPAWLETTAKLIDEETAIICLGAIRRFSDGNTVNEYPESYLFLNEKVTTKFTSGSLFIRKEVFDSVGGYDINLKSSQHTDLGFRLLRYLHDSSYEKKYSNECMIQINVHEGDRIRNNWKLVREGGIQFLEKHHDYFREYDRRGLASIYGSIAFGSFKLKKRKESILFTLKAIRYYPQRIKNYIRLLKYTLLN